MKQKIFSICAFLSLIGSYDSNAAVNSWYLKDTVKYEHMRITNVFMPRTYIRQEFVPFSLPNRENKTLPDAL